MKESYRTFFLCLTLAAFLGACASRPGPVTEMESLPVEVITVDHMIARIQRNGADMNRYFILDENGQIVIKADVQDNTGNFEVIYDLEGAQPSGDSVFTVPFSARNRETGETDRGTLTWRPRSTGAGLLLSFDDRHLTSWENNFDLFNQYGARVTFFIQGDFDSFAARAVNHGHDIGFHSLSHPDLREVTRAVFTHETTESAGIFRRSGIPLTAFAYPFGYFEPWMHETLLRYFSVLRGYGVTFRLYTGDQIRTGFISSRAVDNTVIPGDDHFERLITSMLRTVAFLEGGLILPLTSHDISDAAWAISPRRLEFLLKTAVELGLQFYLYRDFAP